MLLKVKFIPHYDHTIITVTIELAVSCYIHNRGSHY